MYGLLKFISSNLTLVPFFKIFFEQTADFLIKFLSLFDATLKEASSKLRYDYFIDCNQAKNVLNFKPISLEKTLVDTYNYLNTIIK